MSLDSPTPEEEFDAAFAKFTTPEDAKKEEPAPVVEEVPDAVAQAAADAEDVVDPAAVVADGETVAETPTDPDPNAAVVDPAAQAPAVEDAPDGDEILARLSKMIKDKPAAEAPAAEVPATDAPVEAEIYSDDEKAFLTDYEKEWSEVSRAESLKRRSEYRMILNHVFKNVAEYLKPWVDSVDALAERSFVTDLKTQVGDFEDVREDVIKWVGSQPAYLQNGMNEVIKTGTVEEIGDLIERYKKDKGIVVKPTPTPSKKDTQLSDAAKQAADSLAPVSSKRSVIEDQDDPSNFDAAWVKATTPR